MSIISILEHLKDDIIGQPCTRLDVRKDGSISLGLGKLCPTRYKKGSVPFYGFWELGTYNSSWRIIKSDDILLGSGDVFEDFDMKRQNIHILNTILLDVNELGKYDVTFSFSDDYRLDFLSCFSDKDEILHILRNDGFWWAKNFNGTWEKSF